MQVLSQAKNLKTKTFLRSIFEKAASEEVFTLKEIEERFNRHYTGCFPDQGDRCVDDRDKLDLEEEYKYDRQENNARGQQFAGGTISPIRVLRLICDFDEKTARRIVLETYRKNNWLPGDHIDDNHGEIKEIEDLKKRNLGCGNQDKTRAGKIKMYEGEVTAEEVDSGFEWLREFGVVTVLTGHHEANAAGVNLIKNSTYGTREAVAAKDGFFNLDLWAAWELAGELYKNQEVGKSQPVADIFACKFVEAVARDYLQTLSALNGPSEIQIRS